MRFDWRALLRPPRRLRPRAGGIVLILGVIALGLATLNTGNNLLHLLVGGLLGLIALSGWLSEKSISRIHVERRIPPAATAGMPARIQYRVCNRKRRLPTVSLELSERLLRRANAPAAQAIAPTGNGAYLAFVPPGASAAAGAQITVERRGVYDFERLVAATTYPFGFFVKERDLRVTGTLVVRPRTDRRIPPLPFAGGQGGRRSSSAAAGGERGEFRSLRPWRPGDDPRDVHWRSSARRGQPLVREYERPGAVSWWLVLDVAAAADEERQEAAVEVAAAVAARASERGDRFGFAAGEVLLPPAAGAGQLDAVLDLLTGVEFTAGAGTALPAPAPQCVLVTAAAGNGAGAGRGAGSDAAFAAVFRPEPEAL